MASFEVGSDTVWFEGRRLVVDAARDMPDWQVRQHRRPQIRFRNHLYFPVERTEGKWGKVRFVLEPWPERSTDLPGPRIEYDASYVLARDGAARRSMAGEGLGPLIFVAMPVIGLLPSMVKARIQDRLGINPESATRASVTAEAGVAVLLLFFWGVSGWGNLISTMKEGVALFGGAQCTLFLIILALGLDWAFRWGAVFRGTGFYPGFYEWLWGPILARLLGKGGNGSSR